MSSLFAKELIYESKIYIGFIVDVTLMPGYKHFVFTFPS